jgi:hypothetical protein
MVKSLALRRAAAKSKFDRLAQRQSSTPQDLQKQIDAAGELAELNAKTMSVAQAQRWAEDFISERPTIERAFWAGEFVGQVKAFQQSRRGPKPAHEQLAPSHDYDPLVMKARRALNHQGFDLSRAEKLELLELVNRGCNARLETPTINTRELTLILQRLKRELGS